ncbi:MAG: hypothetical protein CL483_12120 [Acidobacteria bacterium]|nr:hypothetical protein [Acidobacteriota bacterium]|tara:strand:- start:3458 stop:3739 length:282 start_codon:yes stop_codon:yes gene_type:complete
MKIAVDSAIAHLARRTGADHGAGGLMMAMRGAVSGGLYGTAALFDDTPDNPDLENSARDVRHEIDFRAVYVRVIDDWLGANFRSPTVDFVRTG